MSETTIGFIGLLIGGIGILLTAVFPMLYSWLTERASHSLSGFISIRPLPNPEYDNSDTYWTVEIVVGKGNWLARLPGINAKLMVFANARFIRPNGDCCTGDTLEIRYGIRSPRREFPLTPNTKTKIVVVKHPNGIGSVHMIGNRFGNSELAEDYHLEIIFLNTDGKILIVLPFHEYIKNGLPEPT